MGHFSMEIDAPTGSNLSGNQQSLHQCAIGSADIIMPEPSTPNSWFMPININHV